MDGNNIFHLLTWVVPGYAGLRMYWYATGPPRPRGSIEAVVASLGWTVAVAVPVMLLLGGLPQIDPSHVSFGMIGTWFAALLATAVAGWLLGKIRASECINTHTERSVFSSVQGWLSRRELADGSSVEIRTEDAVVRGTIAYIDERDEGGGVALYWPQHQEMNKEFTSIDKEVIFVPGSRIVWIGKLTEKAMSNRKVPTPAPDKGETAERGREFKKPPQPPDQEQYSHEREDERPQPLKK